MWLYVILTTVAGTFVVALLVWVVELLASIDIPQDTVSQWTGRLSWFSRLRFRRAAKPKLLDYRRDKRGRFRRVRRG